MLHTIALLAALAASATAHCTRPLLQEAVDAYLLAQTTGETTPFTAHFDNSTWLGYRENSLKVNITSGIIATPLAITHNRSFYDTSSCATFTEVVVNSSTTPYVIGTQLRFTNHKINKVDSIVTKPGDWLFNITGYAHWTAQEKWDPIPAEKRDTQLTIRKAADAYLDVFNNKNVTVPWGTPCVRLEGGLYGDAGPNGTCAGGVPSGVPLTNRRYVVDEALGSVDVLLDFGNSKWPDSHLFRVEGGRLRYVHTLTHCGRANCGV
ncbi:hypothetical protein P171DRAFT_426868 [Karstenula rhodostoma CBS 690.94]|uniref:DUF8021 domain-containing protein n=1 Tax=Karstenula rhodostoma CBS 690.94 TaxID=1392251 RepID=A0A9P4PWA2_9PLEO|nr:hypothetical protein P171DRAFT_426868 [Karstenula rhodostoma CBS 690.94]